MCGGHHLALTSLFSGFHGTVICSNVAVFHDSKFHVNFHITAELFLALFQHYTMIA